MEAGAIKLLNETKNVVNVKKNSQLVKIRMVKDDLPVPPRKPVPTDVPNLKQGVDLEKILKEVTFDQAKNLSQKKVQPLIDSVKKHSVIFGPDLPGYNGIFGAVFPSITFNSKQKPPPIQTRSPSYGAHGEYLYNQKTKQMKAKGGTFLPI